MISVCSARQLRFQHMLRTGTQQVWLKTYRTCKKVQSLFRRGHSDSDNRLFLCVCLILLCSAVHIALAFAVMPKEPKSLYAI